VTGSVSSAYHANKEVRIDFDEVRVDLLYHAIDNDGIYRIRSDVAIRKDLYNYNDINDDH